MYKNCKIIINKIKIQTLFKHLNFIDRGQFPFGHRPPDGPDHPIVHRHEGRPQEQPQGPAHLPDQAVDIVHVALGGHLQLRGGHHHGGRGHVIVHVELVLEPFGDDRFHEGTRLEATRR